MTNSITINLDDILYTISDTEYIDESQALAALFASESIAFSKSLFVNCSDFFAWGCSDGEDFTYSQIIDIFKMFLKDQRWGPSLWVAIQRKEMPQKTVEGAIRKQGIWDLDAMALEHGLRANYYSGTNMVFARYKYELASKWAEENHLPPVEFNAQWWATLWEEFTKANPDWNTESVYAEYKRRLTLWTETNGWV
ncbi:hypothetical protein Xoosp13_392 [Xanthomonas phage Xoo-sp13]|nr:hypothetical protein Xoosp13_392 [Xanthomonas phage Xoo-sp13]